MEYGTPIVRLGTASEASVLPLSSEANLGTGTASRSYLRSRVPQNSRAACTRICAASPLDKLRLDTFARQPYA